MDETPSLDSVLRFPIPVLSNRLILRLMQEGRITIDPFNGEALVPTAYRLCPHRIRLHAEDEEGIPLADEVVQLLPGRGTMHLPYRALQLGSLERQPIPLRTLR